LPSLINSNGNLPRIDLYYLVIAQHGDLVTSPPVYVDRFRHGGRQRPVDNNAI
jgi:hypothetical protein